MDNLEGQNNNNKRGSRDEAQEVEDDKSQHKRSCLSLTTGHEAEYAFIAQHIFDEIWSKLELSLPRMVREEMERNIQSKFGFLLSSSLSQMNETGEGAGSGTLKFKLCFLNQIASPIFTNNNIKGVNGQLLQVAICDVTNSNAIVDTGPLSSAQIEFFVLNGEFSFDQQQEESQWIVCDFNKSVLSQRDGRRPLIVGNDLKLYLKDGVGYIESLSITDNSSWTKSKKFQLGAKVIDEEILAKYSRIGEAVSQPFKVKDQRGEVNKKHHPPSREDEVWRLEGIHRDGAYHKNLSSHGIKNVGDFLKAYHEHGSLSLRKLLGNNVPKKKWSAMVDNALECDVVANFAPSSELQHLVRDEANDSGDGDDLIRLITFDNEESMFNNAEVYPPLNGEASTLYNHNHEVKNGNTLASNIIVDDFGMIKWCTNQNEANECS